MHHERTVQIVGGKPQGLTFKCWPIIESCQGCVPQLFSIIGQLLKTSPRGAPWHFCANLNQSWQSRPPKMWKNVRGKPQDLLFRCWPIIEKRWGTPPWQLSIIDQHLKSKSWGFPPTICPRIGCHLGHQDDPKQCHAQEWPLWMCCWVLVGPNGVIPLWNSMANLGGGIHFCPFQTVGKIFQDLQPILAPMACIGAHSVNPIPGHMFAFNRANPHWGPCASTLATQTWIHGPTWLCKQEFQFSGAHHGQVCNLILHSPVIQLICVQVIFINCYCDLQIRLI